jgi:hypothetical protein
LRKRETVCLLVPMIAQYQERDNSWPSIALGHDRAAKAQERIAMRTFVEGISKDELLKQLSLSTISQRTWARVTILLGFGWFMVLAILAVALSVTLGFAA